MTKLSLVALAVAALTACDSGAEQAASLDTEAAKQAYSVGVSVGRNVQGLIEDYDAMGVPLDGDLIARGVQDAIAGKPALTDEVMQMAVDALNQQFIEKQTEIVDAETAQAVAAGEAYLAQNAAKEGVTVTESGLQYEVLRAGEGSKPTATDVVEVHYIGTLTDGTVFDSSVERGEPARFPLNRVIAGWSEGVQLMNVGSKFRFTVPSELAYGERDMGVIKPNSVLVFEVELLDISKPQQE